jgi:hypothetical protein
MAPSSSYEVVGDVDKVFFPNGWVLDEAADRLYLYYGAGDSVVGLAVAPFAKLMDYVTHMPLHHHRRSADDGADGRADGRAKISGLLPNR